MQYKSYFLVTKNQKNKMGWRDIMSSNWYKYKNLDNKTKSILMNMEKSYVREEKGNLKAKYPISLFLKFGNSETNPYNAVQTIDIYKNFTDEKDYVWISTDSLSSGMSPKKIDEINNAIQNNKEVEMYLIPSKTSGGNNEITHKSIIVEIQGNNQRMTTPDVSLTPKEWINDVKKIWIKVRRIRICNSKKTKDFQVISSKKILATSISRSQYNFGYIEEL